MELPGNYTTTTTNYANNYTNTTTGNPQNFPLLPRAKNVRQIAGQHRPRKSPEYGRQLALRNAPKVKPPRSEPIPPDPIERSVTSGAPSRKTPYEEVREQVREIWRYYLPNAIADPMRAITALTMEAMRAVIEPAPSAIVEKTPNTDEAAAAAQVSASSSLRRLENAAVAFYQVMESEFGSGIAEQPVNATHRTTEDSRFKAAVTPGNKNIKEAVSKIVSLPASVDIRPCLAFEDLMRRIDGKFMFYGEPDMFRGQSIQGRIVVISPGLRDSLDPIRELLNDISGNNDILLTDAYLPPNYLRSHINLDESGVLASPTASPNDHRECLGIDPSRCFIWESTGSELFDREMVSEMSEIALDTIARYPARTVFVVTDSLIAAEFMRWSNNNRPGAAMRLEQLASTVG